ncbi:hypothetical protein [Ktedonospora formicarum]|uniref:Uncharacterized protein n=1 Tax=Ktedonospora formicarum TaxID=2778364 RepID=A0A8J3I4I4_9CHLR|nr:hypothetical protein [Ktedonospora formicarum]GHO46883.1 hypothetical protein KSX_50460 [Ktedonospora formicarum]
MAVNNHNIITFQEKQKGYTLEIINKDGETSVVTSTENCLQVLSPYPNDAIFTINAHYQEKNIGTGRYRKLGEIGQVTSIEVLEAFGAMMGLLETALARRQAKHQEVLHAERLARLVILSCECGHEVSYDPQEHFFTTSLGSPAITCEVCKTILDLETIKQSIQRRTLSLEKELQQQREQLAYIDTLRSDLNNRASS